VRKPGSVTATNGGVDLVQVRVLPLVKTYRPARYRAVAAELDRATEALVHQPQLPHARLVEKRDSRIAGRRVRSYRIDFGPGKTERLAYVLQGKTEYLLLCRRLTDEADDTCGQLFSSFALNV